MSIYALTQKEAGELLGVTPRTLRDWAAEGIPRLADGKYHGPAIVAWLLARNSSGEELDLDQQRARLACAQAEKHEMENALRRGELAEVTLVQSTWAAHIAAARAKLLSLPTKLGPQLTHVTDPNIIAGRIRAEVYAAINELAAWEPPADEDDG